MSLDTDPTIYRQAFSDNVTELIGLPGAPVLMKMFAQENKTGDSVRIDGLIANAALVSDTKTLESRRDFEAGGGLFADWLEIQTPYTGSLKQGSYMEPKTIEATEVLPVKDDVLRGIDVKSPTMMSLASTLYKSEDLLAITAALAPTVLREPNNTGRKLRSRCLPRSSSPLAMSVTSPLTISPTWMRSSAMSMSMTRNTLSLIRSLLPR